MDKKLVFTNDGSHSLFVPEINECYHSKHGSIVEAEHVFIRNGLLAENRKQFNILEVGFGTGLNALLTAQKAKQKTDPNAPKRPTSAYMFWLNENRQNIKETY